MLDFDPSIATGGRFTKAQAREIIDYGRSLGLKPIGYLNLLGHLDRAYQKAPYTQHGGIDIRSDEAYEKFVYPILDGDAGGLRADRALPLRHGRSMGAVRLAVQGGRGRDRASSRGTSSGCMISSRRAG